MDGYCLRSYLKEWESNWVNEIFLPLNNISNLRHNVSGWNFNFWYNGFSKTFTKKIIIGISKYFAVIIKIKWRPIIKIWNKHKTIVCYCKIDGFSRAIFSHCGSDFLKIDLKKKFTVKSAFGRFCICWYPLIRAKK